MEVLAPMLGYKFRLVESAGSSLSSLLSNEDPWKGSACGMDKCKPCKQKSEVLEECTSSNIVYESRCTSCNGLEKGKEEEGKIKDSRDQAASIYVGETSRSLMERSAEHHRDYKTNKEDSHNGEALGGRPPGPRICIEYTCACKAPRARAHEASMHM